MATTSTMGSASPTRFPAVGCLEPVLEIGRDETSLGCSGGSGSRKACGGGQARVTRATSSSLA